VRGAVCTAAVTAAATATSGSLPNIQYRASRAKRYQVYLSAQGLKYFYGKSWLAIVVSMFSGLASFKSLCAYLPFASVSNVKSGCTT
jgi:hypothetical protein